MKEQFSGLARLRDEVWGEELFSEDTNGFASKNLADKIVVLIFCTFAARLWFAAESAVANKWASLCSLAMVAGQVSFERSPVGEALKWFILASWCVCSHHLLSVGAVHHHSLWSGEGCGSAVGQEVVRHWSGTNWAAEGEIPPSGYPHHSLGLQLTDGLILHTW